MFCLQLLGDEKSTYRGSSQCSSTLHRYKLYCKKCHSLLHSHFPQVSCRLYGRSLLSVSGRVCTILLTGFVKCDWGALHNTLGLLLSTSASGVMEMPTRYRSQAAYGPLRGSLGMPHGISRQILSFLLGRPRPALWPYNTRGIKQKCGILRVLCPAEDGGRKMRRRAGNRDATRLRQVTRKRQ